MRLFVIAAVFLLAPAFPVRAVNCHPSEISLSTQAQVDQFQAQHGPCDRVTGALSVSGANIVNLNGLSGLVRVGSIGINDNPALTSLAGLSSVATVDENLWVLRNPAVPSLSGLHNVGSVGLSVMILGNNVLANVQLSALRTVGEGGLSIGGNPLLASVAGLSSLESLGGDLSLEGNAALTTLNGLGALRTIGFSLTVRENASLQSFAGLSSLDSVGFALDVLFNPSLTTLGFGTLDSVGFRAFISSNPLLHSLAGLQSITRLNELQITHSNALTDLDGLASLREVTDTLAIRFCPMLADVDGLSSLTKVGSLTLDANISLRDVDGLAGLTVVDRDLAITNSGVVSIEGLTNLTTVAGALIIGAPMLESLRGLGSLREVGSLFIGSSATTLDDLESLETVSGELVIGGNPRLVSLAALHRIHQVQGLRIEGNGALVDLRGLEGLQVVGSFGVMVYDNDSLRSLVGLDSLTQIGGPLQIGWLAPDLENRALSSLDGLQALTRVGHQVNIVQNPLLADVDGLANLSRADSLSVVANARLGDCSGLTRLLDAVDHAPPGPGNQPTPDVNGFVELTGNAPGCNSRVQILASPPDFPCVRDAHTACLLDERFRVRADTWDFANAPVGPGARVRARVQTYDGVRAETDLSVSFYSFEEGNVELFVKMLDACPIAFRTFWVFAAGATNAEAEVEVLDTWTGQKHRVYNPRGHVFSTAAGTDAFATCDTVGPSPGQ